MFSPKFSPMKLKMNLKLATTRLQMLGKKHDNASVLARKEVASLLGNNRVELAKIKVEQIIRDDYYREALEILETYCSLALARFGLIESMQICDTSIRKAICTIIWATPRVSVDVVEFKEVSKQLTIRYGKEFADDARSNKSNEVCPRVIHKLKFVLPDESIVNGYLLAIAEKYSVDWAPSPPEDEDDNPKFGGGNGGSKLEKHQDLLSLDDDSLIFPSAPNSQYSTSPKLPSHENVQQPQYTVQPAISGAGTFSTKPAPISNHDLAFPNPLPNTGMYPPGPPPTTNVGSPPSLEANSNGYSFPAPPTHNEFTMPDVPDMQPPSYGAASAPPQNQNNHFSMPEFDPLVSVPSEDDHNLDMPEPPGAKSGHVLDYDSLTRRFNSLQAKK